MEIPQTIVELYEHSKYHGVICENDNLFAIEVPELDEWREETIIPKPITSQESRVLLRGGLSSAYEAAQIYTFMVRCIYGKNEVMKLHQLCNKMQNNEESAVTTAHLGEKSQDNTITSTRFYLDEEGATITKEDTITVTKVEEGVISSDEKMVTVTKASSDDEDEAAIPSEENTTTGTKALYQEVEAMLSVKNTTATLKGFSVQEDTRNEAQENCTTATEEYFHEDNEMSLAENTTNAASVRSDEENATKEQQEHTVTATEAQSNEEKTIVLEEKTTIASLQNKDMPSESIYFTEINESLTSSSPNGIDT